MIQMNLQNRTRLTHLENELIVDGGGAECEEEIVKELGWTCTHCYI